MNKIFKSFADMGKALGIRKKENAIKPRRCFKCGGEMQNIPDTNVFICNGTKKDGSPCRNRTILPIKNN